MKGVVEVASVKDMKPGDLMFYTTVDCTETNCTFWNEVHHVGIYIGGGKVIEALDKPFDLVTVRNQEAALQEQKYICTILRVLDAEGPQKNGLVLDQDGKTRLYKNGEVVTSYIGLYEKEPGSNVFYGLKEGVWVENWEGLYLHSSNGRYYFLKDGVWQRGLDTLYKHSLNGKWYYLKNGIWQKGYLGLWQNPNDNGRYYYLNNGLWQKGYDGLYVHSKNQWTYYLRDGIWNRVTEWYKHSQNGQTYYIEIGLWRGTYKDRNGVQKKSTSVVVPK